MTVSEEKTMKADSFLSLARGFSVSHSFTVV